MIRGEEWLPSAPLHLLLYEAFGWKSPEFAHLPLLLKPDGHGKLSKRDGDRLGFPVFPIEWVDPNTGETSTGYRESGYLPEAFVNFLAMLGWNPGSEQEVFSMDQLIEEFSINRVSKKGAKFDIEKAKWFNQHYLRALDDATLAGMLQEILRQENITAPMERIIRVVELVKERAVFPRDLLLQSHFFFVAPTTYDKAVVKKFWKPELAPHLRAVADILAQHAHLPAPALKELVMDYIKTHDLKTGQVMNCIRLAMVGQSMGPDLFEIIATLGVDEAIRRLNAMVERV